MQYGEVKPEGCECVHLGQRTNYDPHVPMPFHWGQIEHRTANIMPKYIPIRNSLQDLASKKFLLNGNIVRDGCGDKTEIHKHRSFQKHEMSTVESYHESYQQTKHKMLNAYSYWLRVKFGTYTLHSNSNSYVFKIVQK